MFFSQFTYCNTEQLNLPNRQNKETWSHVCSVNVTRIVFFFLLNIKINIHDLERLLNKVCEPRLGLCASLSQTAFRNQAERQLKGKGFDVLIPVTMC